MADFEDTALADSTSTLAELSGWHKTSVTWSCIDKHRQYRLSQGKKKSYLGTVKNKSQSNQDSSQDQTTERCPSLVNTL